VFLLSFYARAFSSNVLTTVKLLPSRSKKLLEASIADATSSQSLSRTSKKRILLMDEVDGMAGNEDRGGMAELIHLIKASKIPIICMCNDRNHQKIRSLANHCFDLRFQRPRAEQIKAAMMSVCFKEKLKISPDALTELIVGCNQDVRQVSVDKETNLNEMVPVI
jgi:replication factor C subunit 1